MLGRQKSGSVLCPSCGSLVGVGDDRCLTCGRLRPGLWGFAALLRRTGDDMGFLTLVMAACGALFVATLASAPPDTRGGGLLDLLAPDSLALLQFGATGAWPVFEWGRFWTVLSACWLHGSVLHIVFNVMAARSLIPAVAHLYGPARTVILWVVSGACGALLSSAVGWGLPWLPWFLHGSQVSIGASGCVFGLLGALAYYGRRGGSRMLADYAWQWVLYGAVFGLLSARVDNWGHAGGFVGGWLLARFLDPLRPERGDHVLVAVALLALSAASILASLLIDLPGLPR